MWLRCLYALTALVAAWRLFGELPEGIAASESATWRLYLVAVLVACAGASARPGRLARVVSPGANLAVVSRLFGWAGAGALPLALANGGAVAPALCVALPACALALWKERAWAAWPWYLLALALLLFALLQAAVTIVAGFPLGSVLALAPLALGLLLVRELHAWRRRGATEPPPA